MRSVAVVLLLIACGCGDDAPSDPPSGPVPLDPDTDPVTKGDWYRPTASTTWQWQLLGAFETSYDVDVYDIDLFDVDAATIGALQAAGRAVICYFSGGTYEAWRSDAAAFEPEALGQHLSDEEFAEEQWLDIRHQSVHRAIEARLDIAVDKGCDGVEPDNMDGFTNETGFPLTADEQRAFNRFVANAAHDRELTVALKNDGGQAAELVDYFDLSVNEQCHEYTECAELAVFTDQDKPVFNAEYPGRGEPDEQSAAEVAEAAICAQAQVSNTRTLILPIDLDDAFRITCD